MNEKDLQPYKILVLGSDFAGKITFLKAISEIAILSVHEDFNYPTNFGRFHFYDEEERQRSVYLFSAPSVPDFANTNFWIMLAEVFLGIILILDSSASEKFPEARESLIKFGKRKYWFPIVIAANKQDLEDAWPADAINTIIGANEMAIPVIPCVAKNPQSVANVLIRLCEEYIKDTETEILPNRNREEQDWRFK